MHMSHRSPSTSRRRALSSFLAGVLTLAVVLGSACTGGGGATGAATPAPTSNTRGETLAKVKARGVLRVGVNDALPGFGYLQPDGTFAGFDVDFGRAIAAAVLGDAKKVELVPVSATNRFEALQSGQIDVLLRNTSWTIGRDTTIGMSFSVPTFYDGQGVMVWTRDRITDLQDLDGAVVCALASTTTQLNAEDTFAGTRVRYKALAFDRAETLQEAFIDGRCDAWTADKSQLVARRASFPKEVGGPDALQLLPVTLSREPLAAATKQDDPAWSELVNWVILGMMLADDTGVTSVNVDEVVAHPTSAEVARLLGAPEDGQIFNPGLGLSPGFMRDVVKQVGNYDEVYRRNIEPLGISRRNSPNASYRQGGLMYTPPWR